MLFRLKSKLHYANRPHFPQNHCRVQTEQPSVISVELGASIIKKGTTGAWSDSGATRTEAMICLGTLLFFTVQSLTCTAFIIPLPGVSDSDAMYVGDSDDDHLNDARLIMSLPWIGEKRRGGRYSHRQLLQTSLMLLVMDL